MEVEAAGRAGGEVAVRGREVAITVGVGARGSDVCWIRHVDIHELEL